MMLIIFITLTLAGTIWLALLISRNHRISKARSIILVTQELDDELTFEQEKNRKGRAEMIMASGSRLLVLLRKFDEKGAGKVLFSLFLISVLLLVDKIFDLEITQSNLMIFCLAIIITVIVAPGMVRSFLVSRRIHRIERDMPLFVDLLAICVQSGLTIESGIKFLAENMGEMNRDFVPFLQRLVKKIDTNGIESGLDQLQKELPSREVSMLCVTLKQSLRYGSSIFDYLMELSAEMRELQLLKTEEIIGKLSAKMSIPLVLFFMFPVVIVIAAPGIMRIMNQG